MKYESFKAPSYLMLKLVQPDLIKPAVKNLPELSIKSCFQQAQLLCLPTSCFPLSLDLASDSANIPASKQAGVKEQHCSTLMKANVCSVWKMDETLFQQSYSCIPAVFHGCLNANCCAGFQLLYITLVTQIRWRTQSQLQPAQEFTKDKEPPG